MRVGKLVGAATATMLLMAGCGGGTETPADASVTRAELTAATTEPRASTEPTSATTESSASATADQGDIALCRTHDDIANESFVQVGDEMPLVLLQHYVQGWMDDLDTTSRAATNTRLRADVAAVNYELSLLNAHLQIALNSDEGSSDFTEQKRAVHAASRKVASTCRVQVGGSDFRAMIFEWV